MVSAAMPYLGATPMDLRALSQPSLEILSPWDTLAAIVRGASAIDEPGLHLHSFQEAENFLESYGYVWDHPLDRRFLEEFRNEALGFLQEELLSDEPNLHFPPQVRDEADVRQLLLWASEPDGERQRWACTLLRVMHTVAHSQTYFNQLYGTQIKDQILQRFEPHLLRGPRGLWLGHGPEAVALHDFEVKAGKPLRSIIMKLLHKAENVAADVFDRLGVRFVTQERLDALMVVRYLQRHHLIMFPNVKPSRSRNTLLDLAQVQAELERLARLVDQGRMTDEQALTALRAYTRAQPYPGQSHEDWNAHSSIDYHSFQITCRQMIRAVDPRSLDGEIRFFFPYEIQILDRASFEVSRSGLASHDEYKARQRRAVKRRILGPLVSLAETAVLPALTRPRR
jgi:uncharacterized protein (TIGR04562 family)